MGSSIRRAGAAVPGVAGPGATGPAGPALDTFISGLLGGELLESELLAEMRTMYPVAEGIGY